MNINYEYYKIFYYVGKYRNITQAAEALGSNQPNVSRTIRLMEHEYQCSLCMRTNRGIRLTPEGEKLYSRIKIAVEQIQAAENELTAMRSLTEGSVTVSASETALYMSLLPALNTFRSAYPSIRIRIQNHLTSESIQSVKDGTSDFAVVATPADLPSGLVSTYISDCQDILVAGPAFKNIPCFSLKDTVSHPMVSLSKNSVTFDFFSKLYDEHHLIFRPELEAATTDQILPMIKNNLGIGFVPYVYAAESLSKGEVVQLKLKEDIPSRQICLIDNPEYPLSIAAAMLKKILLQRA